MKKTKFLLSSILLLTIASHSFAQTADEIIQKNITARGGMDNVKKISSVKMSGSINANGQDIDVVMTILNNKGMRQDITIAGMANYTIITPAGGWNYFPVGGQTKPEAMTADDVKQAVDQLELQGPLVDYAAKGHKVEYVGKDQVEGTDCYKLKVTHKSGMEETVYIDASNYYLIRAVDKVKVNGKEQEATINYSNFQKLPEGIMFPMTVGSGQGDVTFKSVEMNKPVDEKIFTPSN